MLFDERTNERVSDPLKFSPLAAAVFAAFAGLSPLLAQAADTTESAKLPDLGTPSQQINASVTPGPTGLSLQGRSHDSKVVITPEYSNQTDTSLGAAFVTLLGDQAAVGLLLNGGAEKKEILLNAGFKFDERQRLILSAGQLQQFLDYAFRSGTEKVGMTQNSAAASYQMQFGQDFLRFLQVNGYTAHTASRDLADKTFAVDTATLYELWNDPRRIAGGTVTGLQGKLGFSPLAGSTVTLSLGQERLSYDLLGGKESNNRLTSGTEWLQQLGSGYQLKLGAESFAAQNRYSLGIQRSLGDASGRHSLGMNLIEMQGRNGLGNEQMLQLSYSYVFGTGASSNMSNAVAGRSSMAGMPGQMPQPGQPDTNSILMAGGGSLLDQVTLRPSGIPSRVLAKVDQTALPTRLVVVDKTGLPAGATVNQTTGDVSVPLGVAVTGIASVTLNAAPFTNSGQFTLTGNTTLVVHPSLMVQPAVGVTDSYVVTLNNSGGGTTLVTVLVVKGSVKISSISVSSGADTVPDAFTFTDVTGQTVSTQIESNAITVAGINAAAAISVTGGEYQINGGTWTSTAGTVSNGQTVKVRHTTSASNNTATNTVLTIGGVSDTFTSTTVASLPAGYIQQGGLTWMPNNIGPFSGYRGAGSTDWNTANTYCTTATINGQTGWHLPTKDELISLYNSGALAGQGWTLGITWSSTPNGAGNHYIVFLDDGYVGWDYATSNDFVTCVR